MMIYRIAAILLFFFVFPGAVNVASAEWRIDPLPENMKPYTETLQFEGFEPITIEFIPIPGGVFEMGSPDDEAGRQADEGPRVTIRVEPMWMMKTEVTWQQYKAFMRQYERYPNQQTFAHEGEAAKADGENAVDAVSFPTPLYDPSFTFRKGEQASQPAASMTQFAARQFTKWLSLHTGRYYRLPTEAEWEYAARAGSKSAYHFGDDAEKLNEYAWHFGNSMNDDLGEPISQQVATKKSNRFGLYDMHGNVAELVLDQYVEDHYAKLAAKDEKPIPADQAIAWPTEEYPRVVRGGSFDDEAADLRTARRRATDSNLKMQDPQLPSSIWWYTDGLHIGFRIVRPIGEPPTDAMQKKWWEPDNIIDQEVLDRQRKSGR